MAQNNILKKWNNKKATSFLEFFWHHLQNDLIASLEEVKVM